MPLSYAAYFNLARRGAPCPAPRLFQMMTQVEPLAREAGALLLSYYRKKYTVAIKDDDSPVTVADTESSALLVAGLSRLTPRIPVISEENDTDGNEMYWAVDPLDGTKEFIDKTGGFCIKIALVADSRPVAGMVFCPAQDVLYTSVENGPAVKIVRDGPPQRLQTRAAGPRLTTLFNKKHSDPDEYMTRRDALAEGGLKLPARPRTIPGLPRNLQIAEGLADVHLASGFGSGPLKGSGFVWDAAADHLILANAGGFMVNLDGTELRYDRPRERMPAYIACGDPALRSRCAP